MMAGAPARFNDAAADRVARLDAKFEELEKNLLDASERRIHDFERRLEHEWIALRQLHEEPLKTFEQRTTALAENCLNLVAESLALIRSQVQRDAGAPPVMDSPLPAVDPTPGYSGKKIGAFVVALAALAAFSAYAFWSVNGELRQTRARAAAAEDRLTRLQQRVDTETREAGNLVGEVRIAARLELILITLRHYRMQQLVHHLRRKRRFITFETLHFAVVADHRRHAH